VAEDLRLRIREYANQNPDDWPFAERLLALMNQIECDFETDERARLLALTQDTFDRHLETRGHILRARSNVAALQVEHQRLLTLLEWLSAARGDGQLLH
jgi:hypothetical protein